MMLQTIINDLLRHIFSVLGNFLICFFPSATLTHDKKACTVSSVKNRTKGSDKNDVEQD